MEHLLSIGDVAERTGVTTATLRFYESEGLLRPVRTAGNQRRFEREALRRVSFIRIAQQVGLTLDEIRVHLASLPQARTPTKADWARLSRTWRPRLDEQIMVLQRLRDQLEDCIGCGCLSLKSCALYNPDDAAARFGAGARYLLGDPPARRSVAAGDP
jgi:MerR family redox-sensitive transcriptional activator SoxR